MDVLLILLFWICGGLLLFEAWPELKRAAALTALVAYLKGTHFFLAFPKYLVVHHTLLPPRASGRSSV
eukprot:COSAG05_NODE_1340_length_5141_cov_2.211226_6_plen_68_part_00